MRKSSAKKGAIKLGPRFQRAFLFAAKKHAGQARKSSTIPYIAHLMGVASLVLEAGGDEDLAIAALLHDVVEDCGGAPMLKEVRRRFGARVAKVVDGCTDAYTEPKPPWRERKEEYLRHLATADAETIARSVSMSGPVSTAGARALFGTIGVCGTNLSATRPIASRASCS
jgi:GTP pyrophosphokinase